MLAVFMCLCLMLPVLGKKGGGKAGKQVEEASDGCRTCKRIVMALDQTVIPKFKQLFKGKEESKMYVGSLSVYMQEELSNICNFDLVHYQRNLRKECEAIIDEHEDDMLTVLMQHARENMGSEAFLKGMCARVARRCPRGVNSTQSEAPPAKRELKTERVPTEEDQGPLRRIVAESWTREVMDQGRDVATLLYSSQDGVTREVVQAMKDAAAILMRCPTVRLGIVNLLKNELPPPHGSYNEGVDGIAMWKGTDPDSKGRVPTDKIPVFWTRDWRESGVTAFDILDFVFRSAHLLESRECVGRVSDAQSGEDLRRLQQKPVWREDSKEEL
uniref:Saposin B-type domain-containing protein n=1 Tax=Hemiselmis tepida TaxID=464990 RepID=A0A6T6U0T7_9CRYP